MKHLFIVLLAACCLTAVGQVPDYVPNDGLVAWYPFSGDASDLSDFGNDGSVQGPSLTTDRFGNESCAYGFDGADDYILIEGSDALEFEDGDFTFSGWFKTSVSKRQWVVSNYLTYGNNPLWMLGVPHNGTLNSIGYDVRDGINQIGENISNSEVVDGFWHHSVFVRSGDSIELYLDGVSIYSLEVSNLSALTEGNPYYIGTDNLLNFQCWEGAIDDVGFWNRGLTVEEIIALHSWDPFGCTDTEACNFDPEANVDDDSCLYLALETLQSLVELSSSSELQVSVPQGLSSWSWSDGNQDSTRTIQPLQEYVLNGFVGEIPELGEEFEGGVVFAIDTIAQTAFLATNEPVGSGAEWGCKTTTTGAISTAFGAGQANTQIILEACQEPDCAARVAASVGPDWYLPSRDELEAIRVRLHNDGLASYFIDNTYNWYWSSTECLINGTGATDIRFLDGFVNECNNKDSYPGGVIAVKNSPVNFCSYTDTLRIKLDGDPLCGLGTVWDEISQTCIVANPSDSNFDGCVQLNDLLDLLTAYGNCAAEDSPWQCGDPLEYQGYDYETVQIGEQCWFAENLRAESYRNGDVISQVNEASNWQSLSEGGRRIYGVGDLNCGAQGDTIGLCSQSSAEVLDFGGYLYNWFVVAEGAQVCPNGWYVPDNDAFNQLLEHAENLSVDPSGFKSTDGWAAGREGTNQTGFNAIGSGYGGNLGNFGSDGYLTGFWSVNNSGANNAYHLQIDERPFSATTGDVFINANNKKYALSIRCIKDAE